MFLDDAVISAFRMSQNKRVHFFEPFCWKKAYCWRNYNKQTILSIVSGPESDLHWQKDEYHLVFFVCILCRYCFTTIKPNFLLRVKSLTQDIFFQFVTANLPFEFLRVSEKLFESITISCCTFWEGWLLLQINHKHTHTQNYRK